MSKLVAILNVTPDSFSDGGEHAYPAAAAARIGGLLGEGADVLDIGAESTRPGATALTPAEEWHRLEPVLAAAVTMAGAIPVSVDTRHAETARRALDMGAAWINDVSGFSDEAMIEAVKPYSCMLVAMHSLGIPPSPVQTLDPNSDPVRGVMQWMEDVVTRLCDQGIGRERIILDPGIGFGKTPEQSFELIKRVNELKQLGRPVLVGHSRKSFLSLLTAKPAAKRDAETLSISEYLAQSGVDYLRVHDVASHRRMLDNVAALR